MYIVDNRVRSTVTVTGTECICTEAVFTYRKSTRFTMVASKFEFEQIA